MATPNRFDQVVYEVQRTDPTIAAEVIFQAALDLVNGSNDPAKTRQWLKTAPIAEVAATLTQQF